MNTIVYIHVSIPDVDECQRDPMLCTNGVCRNSPGSFECICGDGYVLAKGTTACIGKCSEMLYDQLVDEGTQWQFSVKYLSKGANIAQKFLQ